MESYLTVRELCAEGQIKMFLKRDLQIKCTRVINDSCERGVAKSVEIEMIF